MDIKNIKNNARRRLIRYVDKGLIVRPNKCMKCGEFTSYIEAHHYDYNHPLDVIWLCHKCHVKYHDKKRKEYIKPVNPDVQTHKPYANLTSSLPLNTGPVNFSVKIKEMLQHKGISMSTWCLNHDFHRPSVNAVINGDRPAKSGKLVLIKQALDKEFPGWQDLTSPAVFPMEMCGKCNYQWYPRTPDPSYCPNCQKKHWRIVHHKMSK